MDRYNTAEDQGGKGVSNHRQGSYSMHNADLKRYT